MSDHPHSPVTLPFLTSFSSPSRTRTRKGAAVDELMRRLWHLEEPAVIGRCYKLFACSWVLERLISCHVCKEAEVVKYIYDVAAPETCLEEDWRVSQTDSTVLRETMPDGKEVPIGLTCSRKCTTLYRKTMTKES